MAKLMINEEQLGRVSHALDQARRSPTRFAGAAELPAVLSELEEWLDDERQWSSGYPKQWKSLLKDLAEAQRAVGEKQHAYFEAEGRDGAWRELDDVQRALKDDRRGGP